MVKIGGATLEEVSPYFHLPIESAARELGVCSSALKRRCRRLGIKRWPFRKVRSMSMSLSRTMEDMCNSRTLSASCMHPYLKPETATQLAAQVATSMAQLENRSPPINIQLPTPPQQPNASGSTPDMKTDFSAYWDFYFPEAKGAAGGDRPDSILSMLPSPGGPHLHHGHGSSHGCHTSGNNGPRSPISLIHAPSMGLHSPLGARLIQLPTSSSISSTTGGGLSPTKDMLGLGMLTPTGNGKDSAKVDSFFSSFLNSPTGRMLASLASPRPPKDLHSIPTTLSSPDAPINANPNTNATNNNSTNSNTNNARSASGKELMLVSDLLKIETDLKGDGTGMSLGLDSSGSLAGGPHEDPLGFTMSWLRSAPLSCHEPSPIQASNNNNNNNNNNNSSSNNNNNSHSHNDNGLSNSSAKALNLLDSPDVMRQ